MNPSSILLAALAFLLTACAPMREAGSPAKSAEPSRSTPAAHGEMPIWRLDEIAGAGQVVVSLRSPSGGSTTFGVARARRIRAVAARIVAAAGEGDTPDWLLVGTPSINAFATWDKGRPVVAVTLGMVELLQDDEGAWAALIGHELAHFRLGHHQARRSRKEALEFGSSLAGLILSAAGLGVGSIAADATGTLVDRAFSRDDELAADRRGLEYVRLAGLDPQGAVRLQQRLLELRPESATGFLSTHPAGRDRAEALRQLLEPAPVPQPPIDTTR